MSRQTSTLIYIQTNFITAANPIYLSLDCNMKPDYKEQTLAQT